MPKLEPYAHALPYAYAPGVFPSLEALRARPGCVRRLLIHSSSDKNEGVQKLRGRCETLGIRVEEADRALARISQKENCFAAAVFEKYEDAIEPNRPHIALASPSDMGNLGTILRACLGFGFHDLALIRPAADVFDPRVVRASMGALFSLRIRYYANFDAYRADHPDRALYPFMLDGATSLQDAVSARQNPYTLIFGNESTGLPAKYAAFGQAVRIPHSDRIDSLNLAVAVSIAAYAFSTEAESLKQTTEQEGTANRPPG